MMYGITGTKGPEANGQQKNWTTLADLEQDVVNFLLLRGDHAYLTSWCVQIPFAPARLFGPNSGRRMLKTHCFTALVLPSALLNFHRWGGFPDKIGWSKKLFDADYGEPIDAICHETSSHSSIFVRVYSKATIQMNCSSWQPTVTFKKESQ